MNAKEQSDPGTDQLAEIKTPASLAEMLALDSVDDEAETETPGGDAAESSGSDEQTKPVKQFNDLAGATGMELDALYKLEIKLADDGEPVTIEQLKDSYKQSSDLDLRVMQFEEERTEREGKLFQAEAELKEILSALPANAVNKSVLEKIRAKSEQTAQQERQKTLEVIKDWNDPEKRAADLEAMASHLGAYGIEPRYLESIMDHRQFKYIRDNMLRERRVREAIKKVQSGKPDQVTKPKPQAKAPVKNRVPARAAKGVNRLESVFRDLE